MRRRLILGAGAAVALFSTFAVAPYHPAAAAASCAQMNDTVFGTDGRGGQAAQFRALRAKIDAEKRSGATAAAAQDTAALRTLTNAILAAAKSMQSGQCTPRIVAQAATAAQPFTPPPAVLPQASPVPATPAIGRSAHGCSGFDGRWQGPYGVMTLRNGSGSYAGITLQGSRLVGPTLYGTYSSATVAGQFAFTLAANGDSFATNFTSSAGVQGQYTIMQCVGP